MTAPAPSNPVTTDPIGWYNAALGAIQQENERAIEFFRSGRTVRTVVAFLSNPPTSTADTIFDGVIPELRGIALWQRKLNQDANADLHQIPLLVDVRGTGPAFRDAEQKAQELVEKIQSWTPYPDNNEDYKQVIGVLGYAQSRDETKKALKILDKAGILTISTSATADEMLGESTYWPAAPLNSRQAAIAANFATSERTIAQSSDSSRCVKAERALIIEDHEDLYSKSLATQFEINFKGQKRKINFTQKNPSPGDPPPGTLTYTDATELADRICQEISAQPTTIVYWTSRAQDFIAFATSFDTQGTCTTRSVTVLGGDDLASGVQAGVFNKNRWLRLYYSAHRLPAADARISCATKSFIEKYNTFVKDTTKGEDPWINNGTSAVAYDAFHALSRVADITYGSNERADVKTMKYSLPTGGINFNGATGYINYAAGVNQPPVDKTLILVYQTGKNQVTVAACGAYRQDTNSTVQANPCRDAPG
ncbi:MULTISPECIES: ABC transporter substrate-binding protein [Protofrankia]|uniref:Leucine-binding protein domain-containing protein n=1 Tax=Candidatus Protofrankia datiscae TaxID=2716812 RepID=F8B1Y6_9ACTN|nr:MULTISPECIES: ABC transporter substrate-binding protein [Protofrankia]AEH08855.1 hypothetical protein FsymDg_1383 [Candidatus Protofrankia datiscae]